MKAFVCEPEQKVGLILILVTHNRQTDNYRTLSCWAIFTGQIFDGLVVFECETFLTVCCLMFCRGTLPT